MDFGTIMLMIVFFIALVAIIKSFRIVNQYEKGLVVRLGRYSHRNNFV